jgi:hypothetical protein
VTTTAATATTSRRQRPRRGRPEAARSPSEPKPPRKNRFVVSPTRLRIYLTCAAKYRLEYVDKLGRFYHRARAGYAFGHSLHRRSTPFTRAAAPKP